MRSLTKRGSRAPVRAGDRHIRLTGDGRRAAFLFAPTTALTIPSLCRDIPLSAELPRRNASLFARLLAEADILKPEHWTGSPVDSIERCIECLYPGEKLNVCMKYTDDIEREEADDRRYGGTYDAGPYREKAGLSDKAQVGGILFVPNESAYNFTVGTWMDRLEAAKPGLGETILAILHRCGSNTFGIIDPVQAWCEACSMHWDGHEDHQEREKDQYHEHIEWLKSQVAKGTKEEKKKAREAIAKFKPEQIDMFRTTDFKLPKWAFNPKIAKWFKHFEPKDLRLANQPTLVQQEVGREIIEAAHACLAANKKVKGTNDYDKIEYPSQFVAPWYIRFKEDDGTNRVIDDAYEMESQCGENHDISYAKLFEWGDEKQMREAIDCLPGLLEATYGVERLVSLVGIVL